MRILEINNNRITVQMDREEFDNCINEALETQYRIGFDEGYNWRDHCANMDANRSEDDSQERDKGIV